jgi:long-chain acyl-CoA synthetase
MRAVSGVSEVLDLVLDVEPDRVALVARHQQMSYAELDRAANAAAAALRELGVSAGDRVAACLPNDVDIVVAFHGAMRLGAIWVGVNQALALPEKLALLTAAEPTVFICDPVVGQELSARSGGPPGLTVIVADPLDRRAGWASLLDAASGASRPATPDPTLPAAIAYTSGTTGLPRGVLHSQHNLLVPGAALVESRRYDTSLVKGDFLPLTILNLIVLTTLLTAQAGGRCVLMDRRDAAGVLEWIDRESVTVWNGVPALLHSMVTDEALEPARLGSLAEVWTGGADCPEELRRSFSSRFGVPVVSTYGLTEAPSVVTIDAVDVPHVEGASGQPLPHLDVCILDDSGAAVPVGAEGEVSVRAVTTGPWREVYTPMLGYWHEPASDSPAEQTLRTGDIGRLDENGQLFIRDRKKLLIIRGGANVYPAEVERVLLLAAGVAGCAVFGIPDERLGQRVVAVVEASPGREVTESALLDLCRANLAKYKVPERVVTVTSLPRNAMGKVVRAELIDLFEAAAGSGDDGDRAAVDGDARAGDPRRQL